jgi:serine/threonine protein kinase
MLLRVIEFIAVKYHENDLFHGDIKPDNIFFFDGE